MMYNGELFDWLAEDICEECLAANEDCLAGNKACRFSGDFEDLEKLCKRAELLAGSILRSARTYSEYDDEVAAKGY